MSTQHDQFFKEVSSSVDVENTFDVIQFKKPGIRAKDARTRY